MTGAIIPERIRRAAAWALGTAFTLLWAGGLASYIRPAGPPPAAAWAGPVFLWLAALLGGIGAAGRRALGFLVAAGLAGFAAEVFGVRTGLLFGEYAYHGALGPAVFGVPLTLVAAWSALLGYVGDRTAAPGLSRFSRAALGAGWMTAIDALLDPLASGPLGYWFWPGGGAYFGVPARNFAGWFLVSFAVLAAAPPGRLLCPPARWVGRGLVAFFTVLALAFEMRIPAAAGLLCLAADTILSRQESPSP